MVRQRGINDCMIAAFATVCGLTYEAMASAFGYPCAPDQAAPISPLRGLHPLETTFPLSKLGFSATLVVTTAGSDPGIRLPSGGQVKEALPGRKAVLLAPDPILFPVQHALAWDGNHATDCRSGETVPLKGLALHGAMFIDRAGSLIQ